MTKKEARKIRSAFSNGVTYSFGDGNIESCDMDEVTRHAELLNIALEKQIPKKPLNKTSEYDGDYGYCPCCKSILSDYRDYHRCFNCGQALNWSDRDDTKDGEAD